MIHVYDFTRLIFRRSFPFKLRQCFFCLLLINLLLISNGSTAQLVSTYYTWTQSLQSHTPGISTTSTTPASIFTTSWDDNTYTGYVFPFNFTYRGVLYTGGVSAVGVDTDGWVAFVKRNILTYKD